MLLALSPEFLHATSHICWFCIKRCDLPVGSSNKFGTCDNDIGKSVNIPTLLETMAVSAMPGSLAPCLPCLSALLPGNCQSGRMAAKHNPALWPMSQWKHLPAMPPGLASNSQTSWPVHVADLQTSLLGSDPKACLAAWTLRVSAANCWSSRMFETACPPPDSNALASVLL